ncbi:hypothetical protein FD755_021501 [Muntiacus reevesi]|uniref:Uncharacterized protein n=1 Tax=Muntiacus reevesi TaxID=9886 RepID=A0A5N3W1Y0_MUNRE|nr:hypothetical protein FD755_021501 [Muntiacus reevesi]
MLLLARKLKRDDGFKESQVSVRDRLLVKEVLHCFQPTVTPGEGYYQGGKLQFETKWKCLSRTWHPNITETHRLGLHEDTEGCCLGIKLFTDLWNFDNPLTIQAAGHHLQVKEDFWHQLEDYNKRSAR